MKFTIFIFQTALDISPTSKISLEFVDIEFYAPDLVVYRYHPKIHLTWPMLEEVSKRTNAMINYQKCYMCSVIGLGLTIEKEAREKGTTLEMQRYTRAAAIVQNSLAHRILANFIIKIQRPPVPTKSFGSLEDALAWIEKLRSEQEKKKEMLTLL